MQAQLTIRILLELDVSTGENSKALVPLASVQGTAEKGWRWSRGWIDRVILLLLLPCPQFSQMGTEGRKAREQLTAHQLPRRDLCKVSYRKTWMVQKEAAIEGVGGWGEAKGSLTGGWQCWGVVLGSGASERVPPSSSKHRSPPLAQVSVSQTVIFVLL